MQRAQSDPKRVFSRSNLDDRRQNRAAFAVAEGQPVAPEETGSAADHLTYAVLAVTTLTGARSWPVCASNLKSCPDLQSSAAFSLATRQNRSISQDDYCLILTVG